MRFGEKTYVTFYKTHLACNIIFYFITRKKNPIKQNERSVGVKHFLIYGTGKLDFIA